MASSAHSPSQEQQATTTNITGGFSMSHFSSYDHGGRVGGMHHEHHDHDVAGHAALESLGVTFADLPLDRPPADPSMRSQSIKAGSSYKSSLRTDNDSILDDPDGDDSDEDGDDYSRGSGRKPRVKKPHLQGRFSGRLATKEDERRLVEECRLLGPLLGGIGKRGDKSRLTLAKIVRGIATGDVRRCCEERERQLMIAKERLKQYEQPGSAIDALRKEINVLRAELDKKTRQVQQLQQAAQASSQQQQQRMRICTTEDPRQAVLGLSTSAPADPMDGVTNRGFNMAMEMMQPQQQPQGRGFSNYAAGSPGDVLTLGGVRHSEAGQLQLQQQQQARGGQFAAQFRNEVRLDGGGMNGGGPMRYQVAGGPMDSFQIQQQQQQGGFYTSQGQGQQQQQQQQQQSFSGYVMAANAGSRLTTQHQQQQQLEQLAQNQLITSGSANGGSGGMRGMAFGSQVRYQQGVEQGPGQQQGMGFQQFERGMGGGGNNGGYENFNPFGNMQRQQAQVQGIQQSMGVGGGGGGGGMGAGGAQYGSSSQQELHGLPMLVGPKGSIHAAQGGGGGGMHEGGVPGNPSMLAMAAASGANPGNILSHDLDHVFKYETDDGIEVLMGPSDEMAALGSAAAMAAQQQQRA